MFSLTRPSPAMKCASSSSLSYSVSAVARIVQADLDVAVGDAVRHGVVGDVGEEGVAGADGADGRRIDRGAGVPETTMSSAVFGMPSSADAGDHLREAVRVGNEVAVRVGAQQRHVADVGVGQLDAEHRPRPAP